jgi:hypothetical protein
MVAPTCMDPANILVWNICNLDGATWCDAMCDLVVIERLSVVCIQETKLFVISDYDVIANSRLWL